MWKRENGGDREKAFEDPVLNKGLDGTQLMAANPAAVYHYHKHNDDGFQVLRTGQAFLLTTLDRASHTYFFKFKG